MTRFLAIALSFTLLFSANDLHAEPAMSVVPLTLTQSEFGGGRVYAPARIGNVTGQMRLDTGASTTRVKLAPWNKDFPVLAQSVSTSASGAMTQCQDVEATLVGLKASQGPDIARAKYEISRCATSDGDDLLGLDFFRNTRVSLDFDKSEMVFFGDAGAGAANPFHLLGPEKKLVGLDFRVGNQASVGLFDIGAEICAVDIDFVKKNRRLFAVTKEKAKASGAAGGRIAARLYRIRTIDLGEGRIARDIYALAYAFGPLRQALGRETPFILGMNLISRFDWTLDFRQAAQPLWAAKPR